MEVKEKPCKRPGCGITFKQWNSLQRYCSNDCAIKDKPQRQTKPRRPILKVSAKQNKLLSKYTKIRRTFMSRPENKYCPITGQPATEIHHMQGKTGFADDWARRFNVQLLIDERYFLAVTRAGHQRIHKEDKWAREMGYLLKRIN